MEKLSYENNIIKNFGGVSTDILKSIELAWNFRFPKDYRYFLEKYNGGNVEKRGFNFSDGNPGSCLRYLKGIVSDVGYNFLRDFYVMWGDRIPKNLIPIGEDPFGNRILISIKGPDYGKVYFWDHEREADTENGEEPSYDNLTLIAHSFDEFMNSLHSEEDAN